MTLEALHDDARRRRGIRRTAAVLAAAVVALFVYVLIRKAQ